VLLPAKEIHARGSQPIDCYRVQMSTTMGPQICWVDKSTFLLLRIELPSEELRKKVYPNQEFTQFSWRFDLYDATLEAQLPSTFFRLQSTDDAPEPEIVSTFREAEDKPPAESEEESDQAARENPDEPAEEDETQAADGSGQTAQQG
jgi:hypothetical protein